MNEPKVAIERLEKTKELWKKRLVLNAGDSVAINEVEILETAIAALEKQIPAKVTEIHVDDFICPSCGNESCTTDYSKVPSHCPECGQSLYQEN